MSSVSRYWNNWIDRYTADSAYWYIPKGLTVSDENVGLLKRQLKILRKFEGMQWRTKQVLYITELKKQRLSSATASDPDGFGIPMSRMIKQVFTALGFAWIDSNEAITITPAGEEFIMSRKPHKVISRQARKYQIYNPTMTGDDVSKIGLQPVPYLLDVLEHTRTLDRNEYILFCAKAKDSDDMKDTIDGIDQWRKLGPNRQHNIVEKLKSIPIPRTSIYGSRRESIYNTIKLNSSYSLAFWRMSGLIVEDKTRHSYTIPKTKYKEARKAMEEWQENGHYISFQNKKDWIAVYGDPSKELTKKTALNYYVESSQFDMIKETLGQISEYSDSEKRKYFSAIIQEQTLEDILAYNMGYIEEGMTLLHRQFSTEVGRIDLFARDKDGHYTIIELKKGKTDDDVFGQLSRYMGWCRKTKSCSSNVRVRGIIIARKIGPKLWAAVDAHNSPINLMEYDLQMSLEKAKRNS